MLQQIQTMIVKCIEKSKAETFCNWWPIAQYFIYYFFIILKIFSLNFGVFDFLSED